MKKNSLCILIIMVLCSLACERDDICAATTQTTARLIIEAVDEDTPTESLNIQGLRIQGVGNDAPLILDGLQEVSTTSTLALPLRTDVDSTMYVLHLMYTEGVNGMPPGGNPDTITVRYTREDRFVSRACGFSTIYNTISIRIEDSNDDDLWITQIRTENDNQIIEDEAEPHFFLLH